MTSEHRLLFEPSDIQAVELVCDECGASVSLKPSDMRHFDGDQCPNCKEYWYTTEKSKTQEATKELFNAIRKLADTRHKAKVRVRLHVRPDDELGPVTASTTVS